MSFIKTHSPSRGNTAFHVPIVDEMAFFTDDFYDNDDDPLEALQELERRSNAVDRFPTFRLRPEPPSVHNGPVKVLMRDGKPCHEVIYMKGNGI